MPDSNRAERVPQAEPTVVTQIVPGVVDVVVLREATSSGSTVPADSRWDVLTLQRAAGTRCTGAWEIVHGRIERGEKPEQAALREVFEETGLEPLRLYSITVNSFYLHQTGTVYLALVFAAVVPAARPVTLGPEHAVAEWRTFVDASEILAWPREREALMHVQHLLKSGDAGAVEDVLRIV
ncbi:MAG: NUDIX domain-containing protein [Phycisphaerae bacterium]|nr:NUDIX domain-containing protein [Gemmatimonadaceae bacterium]